MKNRRFTVLGLIGVISFVSGAWLVQDDQQRELAEKRRLFQQILSFVSEHYVDSINPSDLYDMAIDGMLRQLDDPYTSFLQTEPFEELTISTTGEYGGVGLRIDLRDGWVTVVAPLADTPAERAGLEAGDQLVEVEGKSTRGWDTQQTANVLRGEPGTETSITVVRAGFADSLHFRLTRAQIHVNSVEGSTLVAPEIGYLRLNTVSAESALELRRAISELRDNGANSLILDLRGNPGGVLEQGVALADLFLDPGDVVVETRGRAQDASRTYAAEHAEMWPDMPMVVLVNERTASAAEIVSGSLQDHDRAVILGTPTFGKGVAYLFVRLSDTEGITVTTSRWFTPSGRSIQRTGPPMSQAELMADASGTPAEEPDSVSSMTFRTEGGRVIKTGNGGIQPDILVRDTLTTPEQDFATALGSEIPAYRNTLTRYALDLKGNGTISDPNFTVTDAMLTEILSRLRQHEGLESLSDEAFHGAKSLISEQFGHELTRYVFGREAELRRMILDDLQARQAVELLRSAETPDALIARATAMAREN
jgi:carboxyl-terminal processing protease